jgi:hypothetical protein
MAIFALIVQDINQVFIGHLALNTAISIESPDREIPGKKRIILLVPMPIAFPIAVQISQFPPVQLMLRFLCVGELKSVCQ